MESDGERRVSDPVHLEHVVDERGLKAAALVHSTPQNANTHHTS